MGLLFKILYSVTAFIETTIILRIFLNIFNVNTNHIIVSWIYDISHIFINPFEGIFPTYIYLNTYELSLTPIVALVFT